MEMTDKEMYEKLAYKPKNVYDCMTPEQRREMVDMCEEYRSFLDAGKTERECVKTAEQMAKEHGFVPFESADSLKPGDKVYMINRKKNIVLAVIGDEDITEGINIVGAHIDSPRMDLKQNPLYEDGDFAYLDTHYYGGIKKYQWVTIPLALHGVVAKKDGTRVNIVVGEAEDDPVLCISDLLIHLSREQMSKTAATVIDGEALNVIVGGRPVKGEEKDAVKAGVLAILKETPDAPVEQVIKLALKRL